MHTWKILASLFLYNHSIFECLCTACTAKSDVSRDTLSIYIMWFVASCHKRALVYMNAFSVLRHRRSKTKENICIFCKMPAKTKQITIVSCRSLDEWAHVFPESISLTLNGPISWITVTLDSNRTIIRAKVTTCTLPSLCERVLDVSVTGGDTAFRDWF